VESSDEDSSDDETSAEKVDQGTMTEAVELEEKAINTDSLSARGSSSGGGGSNPLNESQLTDSTEDLSDNSLAARRRRRRERAQTAVVSGITDGAQNGVDSTETNAYESSGGSSYGGNRYRRGGQTQSYGSRYSSLDDGYYDPPSIIGHTFQKRL